MCRSFGSPASAARSRRKAAVSVPIDLKSKPTAEPPEKSLQDEVRELRAEVAALRDAISILKGEA